MHLLYISVTKAVTVVTIKAAMTVQESNGQIVN